MGTRYRWSSRALCTGLNSGRAPGLLAGVDVHRRQYGHSAAGHLAINHITPLAVAQFRSAHRLLAPGKLECQ